jgi:hypothetical protein
MTENDRKRPDQGKTGPNKAEHQRRAAEKLRENLRRRKEQQRKQAGKPETDETA